MSILGGRSGFSYLSSCHLLSLPISQRLHGFNSLEKRTIQYIFELLSIEAPDFNLYSIEGIIFMLGITHFPLVYLLSVTIFRKIPRELQDAAKVGGASNSTIFRKIVFPMALPGIAGGGLLAFLSNLDNFGIPAFWDTCQYTSIKHLYL